MGQWDHAIQSWSVERNDGVDPTIMGMRGLVVPITVNSVVPRCVLCRLGMLGSERLRESTVIGEIHFLVLIEESSGIAFVAGLVSLLKEDRYNNRVQVYLISSRLMLIFKIINRM